MPWSNTWSGNGVVSAANVYVSNGTTFMEMSTDQFGNPALQTGVVGDANQLDFAKISSTTGVSDQQTLNLQSGEGANTAQSEVQLAPATLTLQCSDNVNGTSDVTITPSQINITVAGTNEGAITSAGLQVPKPITKQGEVWHTLSLSNSWIANASFGTPSYRQNALGAIEFQGLMSGGTNANGTVIATLPAGYRPSATRQLLASADGTISPFNCVLHIDTSGNVTVFGLGTADVVGLDGLFFYL